jgi:hypothetical protein
MSSCYFAIHFCMPSYGWAPTPVFHNVQNLVHYNLLVDFTFLCYPHDVKLRQIFKEL